MSRNVKKTEKDTKQVYESINEKATKMMLGEEVKIGTHLYKYRTMNVGFFGHGCHSCDLYYRCTCDMAEVCAELDILSGVDCCLVEVES